MRIYRDIPECKGAPIARADLASYAILYMYGGEQHIHTYKHIILSLSLYIYIYICTYIYIYIYTHMYTHILNVILTYIHITHNMR